MIVADTVIDLIGRTPIVRLNHRHQNEATILAKLEGYNVSGSVKDRAVKYMIEFAEASGQLTEDKTIIEATSGNTGISVAMIAAAKGYKTKILMSESVSVERRQIIQAYGADLVLTPGSKGTGGAIEEKKRLIMENPEEFVDLGQFKNPVNILAHYQTLGREIIQQTNGNFHAIIVGIGTGGTGVGLSMALKQHNSGIQIIGVMPEIGVRIQGLRNPYDENATELFQESRFDEIISIQQNEVNKIINTARRTAKTEGLLIGYSASAILYIAKRKAKRLGEGKRIVAVLPDDGWKYLSTDLFRG